MSPQGIHSAFIKHYFRSFLGLLFLGCLSYIVDCSNPIITLPEILLRSNNDNISTACGKEIDLAKAVNFHYNNVMQVAICFHRKMMTQQSLEIYNYIRLTEPGYSFVLVNMGTIYLKEGHLSKAKTLLRTYFDEVGGWNVSETSITGNHDDMYDSDSRSVLVDHDARVYGAPCRTYSDYKLNCILALNVIGSILVSESDFVTSKALFQRAIDIGDDHMLEHVYSNLGGLYMKTGHAEEAAIVFLKAFWLSKNPSYLVRRAIIVPIVSTSLEDAFSLKIKFMHRILDIIRLSHHGGSAYRSVDNNTMMSDLFFASSSSSPHHSSYREIIDDIYSLSPLKNTLTDWMNGIQTPHFHLHYYGFHDRPIQELIATMYIHLCPQDSLYKVSPNLMKETPQGTIFPTTTFQIMSETQNNIPQKQHLEQTNLGIAFRSLLNDTTGREDLSHSGSKQLRIGFISSLFGEDEPHGLLLVDVMRRLPKSIFDCHAIGLGVKKPSRYFLEAIGNDNYIGVGFNDRRIRHILYQLNLDCLVFTEMQNEAILHFLGYERFAPIQIVVMGAPVTSGNPSIDYFMSGDRLEMPFRTHLSDKEEMYTEQVVLLEGQAISFPNKAVGISNRRPTNTSFSSIQNTNTHSTINQANHAHLSNDFSFLTDKRGAIYMCFQSLFKIQPSFDFVLIQILFADPTGRVVLQASKDQMVTEKVKNRIHSMVFECYCSVGSFKNTTDGLDPLQHQSCPIAHQLLQRILFIPRVRSFEIQSLLKRSSVILHPFPFGGSKTSFDALVAGVPVVTYPQKYLRGRMAASFYTSLQLQEIDPEISSSVCCIAVSVSDYISKALRLGLDTEYRNKVARSISSRSYRLSNDHQVSFEWARFLIRAMGIVLPQSYDLSLEMKFKPEPHQQEKFLEEQFNKEQESWRKAMILNKMWDRYV